jgi:hypothetical protein
MPAADFGRIAHKCSNFVQTFALLDKLSPEGAAVVEASPRQSGVGVGGSKVLAEIIRVPSVAIGAGK